MMSARRPRRSSEAAVPAGPSGSLPAVPGEDRLLVERLLRRDEEAFATLIDRHHALMVRLARGMVPSRAVAEEVAQETWEVVVRGLPAFELRSSLKTWIFRILVKRARTRGARERRFLTATPAVKLEEGADPAARAHASAGRPQASSPLSEDSPEKLLLNEELRRMLESAIEALPQGLREVITMRDVGGWSAEEVCNVLEISETNQRVMLHRARTKVRARLARYLEGEEKSC
jgi:RNA polymerase sigma-70 factor (ECF subfamily)